MTRGITPRFSLLTSSSTSDTFSTSDILDAFVKVDNQAAAFVQGARSARPAPGSRGRLFFATDSAEFFWDDGIGWRNLTVKPRVDTVAVAKSVTCSMVTVAGLNVGGLYVANATLPVYAGDSTNYRINLPGLPVPASGSETVPGGCTSTAFGRADLWYSRGESLWFVQQASNTLIGTIPAGAVVTIGVMYPLP